MLYAIVSYDDTNETDFVPMKWLIDEYSRSDILALTESGTSVKFYWPPWRNTSDVSKAKRCCIDAETGWPVYSARILSTAG